MDQTKLFLATVRTIRLRLKSSHDRDDEPSKGIKDRFRTRPSSEFSKEASIVHSSIRKLKEFLLTCRKDYIDSAGFLVSGSTMSDDDRDQIDSEVQNFIRTCADQIQVLLNEKANESDLKTVNQEPQLHLHRTLICESLKEYLKSVCKLYSEQKAVRVKRIVERRKMRCLQSRADKQQLTTEVQEDGREAHVSNTQSTQSNNMAELTREEETQFAAENQLMFAEMSLMTSEIKQIEGKVIEISRLQEIFSEKVLDQANQLDDIVQDTVQSFENIRDGNQEIREAIRNKATLRVWILFILIVLSVSLLFLNWYS